MPNGDFGAQYIAYTTPGSDAVEVRPVVGWGRPGEGWPDLTPIVGGAPAAGPLPFHPDRQYAYGPTSNTAAWNLDLRRCREATSDPGYCGSELHGADGGACPGCGWVSHPIPDQPMPAVSTPPWEVDGGPLALQLLPEEASMSEISKHLRGPWVAVLSHRGDIFDSLSEAVACGIEEVDIRVVRGTAAPKDGAFPSGSTLSGDELYRLDDVWIDDDDESVGVEARWEQAQAVAAGLNSAGEAVNVGG